MVKSLVKLALLLLGTAAYLGLADLSRAVESLPPHPGAAVAAVATDQEGQQDGTPRAAG
jgi:hypothetical protein